MVVVARLLYYRNIKLYYIGNLVMTRAEVVLQCLNRNIKVTYSRCWLAYNRPRRNTVWNYMESLPQNISMPLWIATGISRRDAAGRSRPRPAPRLRQQ